MYVYIYICIYIYIYIRTCVYVGDVLGRLRRHYAHVPPLRAGRADMIFDCILCHLYRNSCVIILY